MRGLIATILLWLTLFLPRAHAYTVISAENPDMMGWDRQTIDVALNTDNCPGRFDMVTIVNDAMQVWNEALGGKVQLRLGGASGTTAETASVNAATDAPVIICDPEFSKHTGADRNTTPGQSGVLLDTRENHLVYGYMLLNVEDQAIANLNNIPVGRVKAIVAHELGHILGLGHSPDPDALMYYDVSNKREPVLAQDDVDGAVFLYTARPKADGSPLGCASISGEGPRPGPQVLSPLFAILVLGYAVLRPRRA